MAHQIRPVDDERGNISKNTFTNELRSGYITVDGVRLPEYYKNVVDVIENFEVRDDDVWVCSFPKTGTTWTQEMVWCIANDLDFEGGKMDLAKRFPYLEFAYLFDKKVIVKRVPDHDLPEHRFDSLNFIRKLPSPRHIKTHLPFHLLPRQIRNSTKKPRIIYVARNPKDTCVSYCHHCKLLLGYRGSFDDFCKLFLADKVTYGPFWKHVLGFWDKTYDLNMLFLKYEDMKADLPSVIIKAAEFLGKVLTNEQLTVLAKHLSFASMKVNPAVNFENVIEFQKKFIPNDYEGKFMQSGTVDQWKGQMNSKVIKQFDGWINENLNDTGLSL